MGIILSAMSEQRKFYKGGIYGGNKGLTTNSKSKKKNEGKGFAS